MSSPAVVLSISGEDQSSKSLNGVLIVFVQSSLKDLLENCPWHDPTQDREGQGCSQASADIRGCSSPIRQEEEDGHPLRPEGPQAEGWQKILLAGKTWTRGEILEGFETIFDCKEKFFIISQ